MINVRHIARALVLFIFALASAAAEAMESIRLQLNWTHQFEFAGYYAAKELGYYRDAGLDVQIIEAQSVGHVIEDVVNGDAQYGVGNSSLLLARNAGAPVVVLAVIMQHSPFALVSHRINPTQSIHDLANSQLMLEPLADELIAYLNHEGMPLSRFKSIDQEYELAKFIDKRVDVMSAYTTVEPYFLDQQGIKYSLYSPRSDGIDFYGDNLFTTESEINSHPERVRAFREASLRGWQYAIKHQDEIISLILRNYSPHNTRDFLRYEATHTEQLMHPELIAIGYMLEGRWQHIGATYASLGMLPANFSLDGFLYDANPKPDFFWFYAALATLSALAAVFYVALRFSLLNNQLLRLLHIKSQFTNIGESVNNISHQWKQPLNELGIQLMLIEQRLRNRNDAPDIPAEIQKSLHKSHVLLDFMANTVDTFGHLLSSTRDEKTFYPQQTINEILNLIRDNFELHRITIEYQAESDICLKGSSREFSHVLLNILHNAQFALLQREIQIPEIDIRSFVKEGNFHLVINDNGGGIKIKPIKNIFRLGVSEKRTDDSGVGLYIAKRIIEERFAGTIHAQNSTTGAQFHITLPCTEGACTSRQAQR